MREITSHIVEGDSANHQLKITVHDEPGAGGANHLYRISGLSTATNASDPFTSLYGSPADHATVLFQNGPIKEVGVNGVTQEALLAIIIDRLKSFQEGPFASEWNGKALVCAEDALSFLQTRTRERIKRGVEGTHEK